MVREDKETKATLDLEVIIREDKVIIKEVREAMEVKVLEVKEDLEVKGVKEDLVKEVMVKEVMGKEVKAALFLVIMDKEAKSLDTMILIRIHQLLHMEIIEIRRCLTLMG